MLIEEEVLGDEPWFDYVEHFKDLHQYQRDLDKHEIPYPSRMQRGLDNLEIALKNMNKGTKPNEEARIQFKKTQNCLLYIKRDIAILVEDPENQEQLLQIAILMVQILDEYIYVFQEFQDLIIQILICLNLKDQTQTLLINCISLKTALTKILRTQFIDQKKNEESSTLAILLTVLMIGHYDFILNPDYQLCGLLIDCYNYARDQKEKIEKMGHQTHESEHQVITKRAQKQQEDAIKPEDLYMLVSFEASYFMRLGLSLMPKKICDMPVKIKMQKFKDIVNSTTDKNDKFDVFLQMLIIKAIQICCADDEIRSHEMIAHNGMIGLIMTGLRHDKNVAIPRELFKTLSHLLKGFDDLVLWLKFDSQNLFDNSCMNEIKIHGDPVKLSSDNGLFYDGCGADFEVGSVIELERTLKIEQDAITVCFWMVNFNAENQRLRSTKANYSIRTLIGSSDGITSLIFTDTRSQLFGITNISQDPQDQSYGLKFFEPNNKIVIYQGWNHVAVVLHNKDKSAFLYLNGSFISAIHKVKFNFDIKFIGNCANLQQPFGYICDLRIYPRVVVINEFQLLGNYDKNLKLLNGVDMLKEIKDNNVIADLKKFLLEKQKHAEPVVQCLIVLMQLCQFCTDLRMEIAKANILEILAPFLRSPHPLIRKYTGKVICYMR